MIDFKKMLEEAPRRELMLTQEFCECSWHRTYTCATPGTCPKCESHIRWGTPQGLAPGWAQVLEPFFHTREWKLLWEQLDKEYAEQTIYPPRADIFTALALTDFDQVKVVVIGQDPYHGPQQAHGLAFSVPPGVAVPPSLRNVLRELESDLGHLLPDHGNLAAWAARGVLLLNDTLTVREGKAKSHQMLGLMGWPHFTDFIVKALLKRDKPPIFILRGVDARKKADPIIGCCIPQDLCITGAHPSPMSANKGGFFGGRYFSRANKLLQELGHTPIDWALPSLEWKRYRVWQERPGQAGPLVIEAPSVGVAVEEFCASCGVLAYDLIVVEETLAEADVRADQELAQRAASLDRHHRTAVEVRPQRDAGMTRAQARTALALGWTRERLAEMHKHLNRLGVKVVEVARECIITEDGFACYAERPWTEFCFRMHWAREVPFHYWTDGSGTTADQPCGGGVVCRVMDGTPGGFRSLDLGECFGLGTNNVAELSAVWRALTTCPDLRRPVVIHTDSLYAIGCCTRDDWRPKKNLELIAKIRQDLGRRSDVTFIHVPAHRGIPENELADRLANQGRLSADSNLLEHEQRKLQEVQGSR